MIYEERIKKLNKIDIKERKFIVYWMQSSHRTKFNLALDYSIFMANRLDKPVIVFFAITTLPEGNERNYHFMLEGLSDAQKCLEDIGVKSVFQFISPEKGIADLSKNACLIVVDKGYLRILKNWYSLVAESVKCPLYQVEDNAVIPVKDASVKEEYSAATFRPKVHMKSSYYLTFANSYIPKKTSLDFRIESLDISKPKKIISNLRIGKKVKPAKFLHGGTSKALDHLNSFLKKKLVRYDNLRNDPNSDVLSNMSPYLHFGQISPIQIANEVISSDNPKESKEVYLEELLVRRELAINYIHYNENYDSFEGLPNWAKKTLYEHMHDNREYLYTLNDFENANTHDPYWNAAQNEMLKTGKMHGYMRMYWGKKIIEWTRTPKEAFKIALYLNNKYELDGRDPNGFTGVAWCFGKHDRPWKERAIFGKIRYMNDKGLKRKFDADKYIKKIQNL